MAGPSFVSKNKFLKAVEAKKEAEKTTAWSDLDVDEIYKITHIDVKGSKYGECYLTSIENQAGEEIRIFAPTGMIKRIRKERKETQTCYFMSEGVEVSRVDKKKKNKYELIFEEETSAQAELFSEMDA